MYNFIISCCDTDSITFSKPTQEPFTEEEVDILLNELNDEMPEGVSLDLEEVYEKIIVFKAKNYILFDGKKIKTKGSSLRSSTLELALRSFIDDIVKSILNERNDYIDIYNKYIKEACNIKTKEQMKQWSSKRTLTEKVYSSKRTNESKLLTAIEGKELSKSDKVWVFFREDESLCLVDDFSGEYDKIVLCTKLWKCSQRFSEVLKIEFPKYHLKKTQKLLGELLEV